MQPDEFFQALCETFAELGAPRPKEVRRTLLLRDRSFVGHCYRCGDFYSLWSPGSRTADFYSQSGVLLRTVAVPPPVTRSAA